MRPNIPAIRIGLAQPRKEGLPHGRRRSAFLKAGEVLQVKVERVNASEIGRQLRIGRTTARRILAAAAHFCYDLGNRKWRWRYLQAHVAFRESL